MDQENRNNSGLEEQITVTDLIVKITAVATYLKARRLLILIWTCVFAAVGLTYALLSKPTYTATSTFVLEETDKSGLLGQYASIASLANLGGDNSGGIFKGDNIIELYKSQLMIKKTLLSRVNINGRNTLLINRYISFNKLQKKWGEDFGLKNVSFDNYKPGLNLTLDSLFNNLPEIFNEANLSVMKPDKKLSIIQVSFTSKDEYFAKEFTDKLVENVNNFYVQTKLKRSTENVNVLQHQADSVKTALNLSINGVAYAIEAAPLANPLLTSQRSTPQKKQVDVQTNTAIYTAIIQNLELAKMSLLQARPLIQVIDAPAYPLKKNHVSKAKSIFIGGLSGIFLCISFLLLSKLIHVLKLKALAANL